MNQSSVGASAVRRPLPSRAVPLALQGELIDRIEYHVTQATDYVDYGRVEIRKAGEYAAKARKVNLTYQLPRLSRPLLLNYVNQQRFHHYADLWANITAAILKSTTIFTLYRLSTTEYFFL